MNDKCSPYADNYNLKEPNTISFNISEYSGFISLGIFLALILSDPRIDQ